MRPRRPLLPGRRRRPRASLGPAEGVFARYRAGGGEALVLAVTPTRPRPTPSGSTGGSAGTSSGTAWTRKRPGSRPSSRTGDFGRRGPRRTALVFILEGARPEELRCA
ncbi:MAG: hypothetical protein MZV49_00120 [Rhodopseudomonas palustris]|nr:hypothetical protein [Rhodopseudomonas palustris]